MNPFLLTLAITTTVIPFERDVTRLVEPRFLTSRSAPSGSYDIDFAGDANDMLYYQGFSFLNTGPNAIVPTGPVNLDYAFRSFSFTTEDRARRDVYLWVTDYNGSGQVSDMYESVLVFLPRLGQMSIQEHGDELAVTLATGEEVVFSASEKTIRSGVLSEEPLDYDPDRRRRKFPRISYHGTGLVIRSNLRANDPRLAKTSLVLRPGKKDCIVPTEVFWTYENYPHFKFIEDEPVYATITKLCGKEFLENE